MEPSFRGLALGLSRKEVEGTLRKHELRGQVRAFHPLATLALGLSREALLDRSDIPTRPYRYDLPVLLGLWALTSILFFVTLISFFDGPGRAQQPLLILATAILATAALGVTAFVATKPSHPAVEVNPSLKQLPFWALISDPFIGVVVTLLALLVIFLLLFIWLPVLLLLLGALSLGGLWNAYRACLVVAEDDSRLAFVGRELLRRGAVLSRTWDIYLDSADKRRASEARGQQDRLHRAFVAVGLSSLILAVTVVLSRAIPWIGWIVVSVTLAGLTAVTLVVLLWEVRERILRRQLA